MSILNNIIAWLAKGLMAFFILLAPIKTQLILVSVMPLVDFIFGILAARQLKEPITSWKMKRSISKIVTYIISILLAYLLQNTLNTELPLIQTITVLILISECQSILENFKIITGIDIIKDTVDNLQKLKSINSKKDKK